MEEEQHLVKATERCPDNSLSYRVEIDLSKTLTLESCWRGGTLVLKSRANSHQKDNGHSHETCAFSCLGGAPERNEMKNGMRLIVNALPRVVWTASLEGRLPWLKLSA